MDKLKEIMTDYRKEHPFEPFGISSVDGNIMYKGEFLNFKLQKSIYARYVFGYNDIDDSIDVIIDYNTEEELQAVVDDVMKKFGFDTCERKSGGIYYNMNLLEQI